MNFRLRTQLISTAVLLIGISISGALFFLNWAFGNRYVWNNWLMFLSYAVFIGAALIAFILQLGAHYDLPRGRVIGFFMIIGWVAAALISTTLDTISFLSKNVAQFISYIIVLGGLAFMVIPGFLLLLFPWPPKFLHPKSRDRDDEADGPLP